MRNRDLITLSYRIGNIGAELADIGMELEQAGSNHFKTFARMSQLCLRFASYLRVNEHLPPEQTENLPQQQKLLVLPSNRRK